MGTIIDYEYQHTNRLRASPNNRVVTRPSEKVEGNYYMQNKPNLLSAKMNLRQALTKDYENIPPTKKCENKPNQTQFQPKNEANKPNQTQFQPKNEANKPNQTQFLYQKCENKPNQTQSQKLRFSLNPAR